MTVCLFVHFYFICLSAGLCKYYWLDLNKKECENGSLFNLDPPVKLWD